LQLDRQLLPPPVTDTKTVVTAITVVTIELMALMASVLARREVCSMDPIPPELLLIILTFLLSIAYAVPVCVLFEGIVDAKSPYVSADLGEIATITDQQMLVKGLRTSTLARQTASSQLS
jgi:hypothetical protein